jgi:hypothetical protein
MPTPAFRVALIGMSAVIVFDALASLASLGAGFNYEYSAFGSLLLYVAFGSWAGRVRAISFAVIVGALMGLSDASLGWAVSWILGPGRWQSGIPSIATWALIALQIVAVAALCGLLGGVLGKYLPGGKRREA